MTLQLFVFSTLLSLACAGIAINKRCTDCNHVNGLWVNNITKDVSNDADDVPLKSLADLDEIKNENGTIGGNNVGGQHQVLREERCTDCGNVGGIHNVIVNECIDCSNNGGRHNNNIFPNNFRRPGVQGFFQNIIQKLENII